MSRNTLENDLMRNAHDRLVQWRKDTAMRCNIADLNTEAQISMIFTCLVGELVQLAAFLEISDEDFAILMQQGLREWKQKLKDFEQKGAGS